MSPQLSARQNRFRLIAVFIFTALVAATFQMVQGNVRFGGGAKDSKAAMFMGLREAKAAEIHQALPGSAGKPTLLSFTSRLCHDCKRMAPVLSQFQSQHPQVYFLKVDVLDDKQKYPEIFRAFKPVSVPTNVFINPQGEIKQVFYDYEKLETLVGALKRIQPASSTVNAQPVQ